MKGSRKKFHYNNEVIFLNEKDNKQRQREKEMIERIRKTYRENNSMAKNNKNKMSQEKIIINLSESSDSEGKSRKNSKKKIQTNCQQPTKRRKKHLKRTKIHF